MTKEEILSNEFILIPIVVVILLAQSTWLFLDARKRGHNYWLWGLLGLIQAPWPSVFYLIFVRKMIHHYFRRNR
ncbi:sigma-Y antisigma factor component [Bacillus timonensis]|nr:sigma-Y antisigma factor component [Bacillus timonensis]